MDQGEHGERALEQGIVRGVTQHISGIVLEVEGAPPGQVEDVDHAAAEQGELIEHGRAASRRDGLRRPAQFQHGRARAGGGAGPDPEAPTRGPARSSQSAHRGLDRLAAADGALDRAAQRQGGFGQEHIPQESVLDFRAAEIQLFEEALAHRGEPESVGGWQHHRDRGVQVGEYRAKFEFA